MRIAHLSDLHIGGSREILARQESVLLGVAHEIRDHRADLVVLTGDLYGSSVPYRSRGEERAILFRFCAFLRDYCDIIVVAGNHDQPEEVAELAYVGVTPVYLGATVIQLLDLGVEIVALPYPNRRWLDVSARSVDETRAQLKARYLSAFQIACEQAAKHRARPTPLVALGHLALAEGSPVGSEIIVASEPVFSVGEIPGGNSVDGDQRVSVDVLLLGHFHRGYDVPSCFGPKVTSYAGSLWPTSYAEEHDHTWSLIEINEGQTPKIERIDSGAWRVKTLEWHWRDGKWASKPVIDCILEDVAIKARLIATSHEIAQAQAAFDREIATLRDTLEPRGCPLSIETEKVITPVFRSRAPEIAKAKSIADQVVAYWDQLSDPPSSQDREMALERLDRLEQDSSPTH